MRQSREGFRRHLSYANVMATFAVFIALGGGAYAVTKAPHNSVVSSSIKNGQVKSVDVGTGQIRTADIDSGQVTNSDIGSNAVTSAKLACAGNGSGDSMVKAGSVCIDKYEVSVWSSPTGGTQYGSATDNYPCDDNGQDCKAGTAGAIYARSVAGVTPSRYITYFQAQQALANSGKRLPSNAEWQTAVAGTPDPGTDNGTSDCNVITASAVVNTGTRSLCVSNFGANDMVGNLGEWVGDWDEATAACLLWPPGFGSDTSCVGSAEGDTPSRFPGALIRGGLYSDGSGAGPFAVNAQNTPSTTGPQFGFRGAR